jgi:hypothetical protein
MKNMKTIHRNHQELIMGSLQTAHAAPTDRASIGALDAVTVPASSRPPGKRRADRATAAGIVMRGRARRADIMRRVALA